MNEHVKGLPSEFSVPDFGHSNIDRLFDKLERDSKELDFHLNLYSFSEHNVRKINAPFVLKRLRGLVERWEKINGKI